MALGGILATALNDFTLVRTKVLTVGGLDVTVKPRATGNGLGTPIDTVRVKVAGPGGVSTLDCIVEDPESAFSPQDGDEVVFWNIAADVPIFGGFVDHWDLDPRPGGLGRNITLSCVGYEIILDWAMLMTDYTVPLLMHVSDALQTIVSLCIGAGPLRTFQNYPGASSQAYPIRGGADGPLFYPITIVAGTSLRDAIRQLSQGSPNFSLAGVQTPNTLIGTVDFYRGLRLMKDSAAGAWASDFASLTVTDTGASSIVAHGLKHTTDASQIVRGVYVKGANAAGTGYASDGTGKPGRIAYINDSTIDTAEKLSDAQGFYLNQSVVAFRGIVPLEDWTPTAGVTVGSLLILTDAQTGATATYRIMQIDRSFNSSGREDWSIGYGGLRPSAVNQLRRLTRGTLS